MVASAIYYLGATASDLRHGFLQCFDILFHVVSHRSHLKKPKHITDKFASSYNLPVTKIVEPCVRDATVRHVCIIWLYREGIFKVKSSFLSSHPCFLSSQAILTCFAIEFRTHSSTRLICYQRIHKIIN